MRWKRYSIAMDMTGITRKRAAEILAETFKSDYKYNFDSGGYTIKDRRGRIWNLLPSDNIKAEKILNSKIVGANYLYQIKLITPFFYANDFASMEELTKDLKTGGALVNDTTKMSVILNVIGMEHAERYKTNIAKKYYGYDISVLDLRNPTQSDGFNMLHMVNRYMDDYLQTDSLVSKAKAEKYAKIISKTIMNSGGFDSANAGQNAFFYDSAEGLITSVILVISEFCSPYALLPLQRQNKKEAIEKRLKYIENMRNFCIENKVAFLPQKDSARKEAETAEIVILFKPQKENDGEPGTHHGEERHIISVFKLIQDLLGPSEVKGKSQFKLLMELLPEEHKARWMSGAALNTSEQAMASVLSTALSRLNAFLDSEIEQLLCFETKINTESFCKQKSAVFLIMPEEDDSKYFLISLIVQQLYREMLSIADEMGGKLPNRVMFFLDEFGTLPAIQSAEMMFSASRSRRISFVPIIQSLAQLEKNYGKEGKDIIIDNCQICIYGGFAPNSKAADVLSKILGERTVMTGSVSQGKDKSKSLQMTGRPLMTADELKVMPKDTFIVTRTGVKPMKTILKLFFEWGIQLNEKYALRQPVVRKVCYADKKEIRSAIIKKYGKTAEFPKLPTSSEPFFNGSKSGLKDIGKNMKSR